MRWAGLGRGAVAVDGCGSAKAESRVASVFLRVEAQVLEVGGHLWLKCLFLCTLWKTFPSAFRHDIKAYECNPRFEFRFETRLEWDTLNEKYQDFTRILTLPGFQDNETLFIKLYRLWRV